MFPLALSSVPSLPLTLAPYALLHYPQLQRYEL